MGAAVLGEGARDKTLNTCGAGFHPYNCKRYFRDDFGQVNRNQSISQGTSKKAAAPSTETHKWLPAEGPTQDQGKMLRNSRKPAPLGRKQSLGEALQSSWKGVALWGGHSVSVQAPPLCGRSTKQPQIRRGQAGMAACIKIYSQTMKCEFHDFHVTKYIFNLFSTIFKM